MTTFLKLHYRILSKIHEATQENVKDAGSWWQIIHYCNDVGVANLRRRVSELVEAGLLVKENRPEDRNTYYKLTSMGVAGMRSYEQMVKEREEQDASRRFSLTDADNRRIGREMMNSTDDPGEKAKLKKALNLDHVGGTGFNEVVVRDQSDLARLQAEGWSTDLSGIASGEGELEPDDDESLVTVSGGPERRHLRRMEAEERELTRLHEQEISFTGPEYEEALQDDDEWATVRYLQSLGTGERVTV